MEGFLFVFGTFVICLLSMVGLVYGVGGSMARVREIISISSFVVSKLSSDS